MRADNSKNLTPFKKGHKYCGGSKKGSVSLTTTLRKILDSDFTIKNPFTHKKEAKKASEWINLALIAKAMKGSVSALNLIYDRVDGKVAQQLFGDLAINVKQMSDEELEELTHE